MPSDSATASSRRTGRRPLLAVAAATALAGLLTGRAALAHPHPHPSASPASDPFHQQMDEAMARMDAGMSAAAASGDPDVDFARMMIPHHQGAIDMALAELRFGRDERLRRLAQGIVVEQRQEIQLMQSILDAAPATSHGGSPRPHP